MNKLLMFFVLFLFFKTSSKAQEIKDTIQINKTFIGTVFKQNNKPLKPSKMIMLMENYPEASNEMKKARNNYIVSSLIGGVGAFMVGWSLGSAIGGGKSSPTMLGLGTGLIVVSVPFAVIYDKRATKAVRSYNKHLD